MCTCEWGEGGVMSHNYGVGHFKHMSMARIGLDTQYVVKDCA